MGYSSHNLKPTISTMKRVGQSRNQNDQSGEAMIRKQVDRTEGLLIIRNTPLQCGFSPAQSPMVKRLRDNLPCVLPSNSVTPKKLREEIHFNNSTAKTSSYKFKNGQLVRIAPYHEAMVHWQNHTSWSCTTPIWYTDHRRNHVEKKYKRHPKNILIDIKCRTRIHTMERMQLKTWNTA